MPEQQCDLGMVGLGVMGRNLLLNMADHGYTVCGFDTDGYKVQALRTEAGDRRVHGVESPAELVGLLKRPRTVMMLVPAGEAVDSVIAGLLPYLGQGDIIIDGGNSHFRDTDRRQEALAEKGIHYLGTGISGGESGARHGPSIMPGGPKEAYRHVRPILEAVSARVDGEPCLAYMGLRSAGHYVKMVHNGIEYGLMQLIAETYDLMRRGLNLTNQAIHAVYSRWNSSDAGSYLLEITSRIFEVGDEKTGDYLVDAIRDEAGQKGTGKWASQEAMDLHVPAPNLDVAVLMRDLSDLKEEREEAGHLLGESIPPFHGDRDAFLTQLGNALFAGSIITYGQGMALLRAASQAYGYDLDLKEVARIWRGGCIIRTALLERIQAVYRTRPGLPNILLDQHLAREITQRQMDIRTVVSTAAQLAIPAPGMTLALGYFDAYRSSRLPTNLIQAQRDYFGAHQYQRIDADGWFHTEWQRNTSVS